MVACLGHGILHQGLNHGNGIELRHQPWSGTPTTIEGAGQLSTKTALIDFPQMAWCFSDGHSWSWTSPVLVSTDIINLAFLAILSTAPFITLRQAQCIASGGRFAAAIFGASPYMLGICIMGRWPKPAMA